MHRIAAAALLISALSPPVATAAESPESVRALRAHVGFLADDLLAGRDAGSEGYEIAARYVAARFGELGLEPAGDDGSYLQQVPLRRRQIVIDSAALRLHRDGGTEDLQWAEDFLMWGDPARAETEVTAPLVFVGHGVSAPELGHDDYADVDVDGRIVVRLSGAPAGFPHNQRAYYSSRRTKDAEAVRRGAVGILTLRTRTDVARRPWERSVRFAGRPGMGWLDDEGRPSNHRPEIRGAAALSEAGGEKLFEGTSRSLDEVLDAADAGVHESFELGLSATLSQRTEHSRLESSNVLGLVRGRDPELAGQYVVFTAHLDHVGLGPPDPDGDDIYNGAYDNAMGVAVLLEVARRFATAAEPPRRSLLFAAVAAEEKGLLGSDYFAERPTVPLEGIVANVNFDMPLFLFPPADVTAFGAEHSSLGRAVEQAAAAAGFEVAPDPMPEEVIFIRSDQYSFVRRGVPAVYLVTGRTSLDPEVDGEAVLRDFLRNHYHHPSDELSLHVDWDSAARFVRANYLLGREIADADERPSWNEGDFFGELFGSPASSP